MRSQTLVAIYRSTFSVPCALIGCNVRVVEIDGQPWFVAADVCRALSLYLKGDGTVNVWNALRCLDPAQHQIHVTPSWRGGKASVISEGGLYRMAMRSDKPEARQFQNWVTDVVLPAIRKDGGYIAGEEKVATGELAEAELVLKAMNVMQRKITRLAEENTKLTIENADMREELTIVTMDEYRALKPRWWPRGWRQKTSPCVLTITKKDTTRTRVLRYLYIS